MGISEIPNMMKEMTVTNFCLLSLKVALAIEIMHGMIAEAPIACKNLIISNIK